MPCHMALVFVLACVMAFPAPLGAKIYVWTDDNSRTHYCNDIDDVPKDYKEKCRTIECQTARENPSLQERPKAAPASPQSSIQPASYNQAEMEVLLNEYREKRKAMQEYRKRNQNFQTPEYEDLKRELNEIKLQLTKKKPHHSAPN